MTSTTYCPKCSYTDYKTSYIVKEDRAPKFCLKHSEEGLPMSTRHRSICPVKEFADAGYAPLGSCQCERLSRLTAILASAVKDYLDTHDVWHDEELINVIHTTAI